MNSTDDNIFILPQSNFNVMPRRGKRKYTVEFDDYLLTSLDGEISLINEIGQRVNWSYSDIGDRIAKIIAEDPFFYYKVIPLTKYYEIVTYSLIESVIRVGGFYGDLLDACYKKDEKDMREVYLPYAFNKISEKGNKIYDPISDDAIKALINRYNWDFIRIYEDLEGIFRVDKNKAFNKVIEEISVEKDKIELDLFMLYVLYEVNVDKAKEIINDSIIAPNLSYESKYIIPRWGVYLDNKIIAMINDLGVKVHNDALRFKEIQKLLEMVDRDKVKVIGRI